MDVAYSNSGASSRTHYQIVRSVENAPEQSEELLLKEVQRARQRMTSKHLRILNTSEIRKELIVLLYCLNTSAGAVNPKALAFALPSAVYLAEAGVKVSEKHSGYLFCSEVMPQGHELELMLVNTLRKDLVSSSVSRISLALEYLVSSPFADVIPAVHTRCTDLLSHPSVRIKILAMHALHSLACFAPEILHEEKVKLAIMERMFDGDESVVRAALKVCLSLAKDGLLKPEDVMERCFLLLNRISDKHEGDGFPTIFKIAILSALSDLVSEVRSHESSHAKRIIPPLFRVLRRSVRSNSQSIILGCFRLLGKLPPTIVAKFIISRSQGTASATASPASATSKRLAQPVHPVALIRYFLSSRELNEHYLFLSCLSCLDPSLWAGTQGKDSLLAEDTSSDLLQPSQNIIQPVLDQWEVERVLLSLESDDEGIRAMTLQILISMDPSLVESCYERALAALRESGDNGSNEKKVEKNMRAVSGLAQRALELSFSISAAPSDHNGERVSFAHRIRDITDALDMNSKVLPEVVQSILIYVRKKDLPTQREILLDLFAIIQNENSSEDDSPTQPVNATFLLAFLALLTELGPEAISTTSQIRKIIQRLAVLFSSYAAAMQEPILLTMSRLVLLLPPVDLSTEEVQDALRSVGELQSHIPSASSSKKMTLLSKRCDQFRQAVEDPESFQSILGGSTISSLPEFALLLEQLSTSPPFVDEDKELSEPARVSGVKSPASLNQRKLRYDAYASPPAGTPARIGRARNFSPPSATSELKILRSPSTASVSTTVDREAEDRTPGASTPREPALTAGSRMGASPDLRPQRPAALSMSPAKTPDPLIALESPFISEPLVDVKEPPGTPPYVSANTSLRTSPEPDDGFEELWSAMAADEHAISSRGWCENAVEAAVLQLQSLGLRMDVVPGDVPPFIGDLKISLRSPASESGEQIDVCGLLRLHEEDDGSCLWQAKCNSAELGSKLKELLR